MKYALKITLLLTLLLGWNQVITFADGNPNAQVRLVHAVPGGPTVDVYLVNHPQPFTNIAYAQISDYVEVAPASHTLRVLQAGTPPDQPALVERTESLSGNTRYSIVVGRNQQGPRIMVFKDDNSPTPPNKARVTFIHVSPDMPNVDICAVGQGSCFLNNIPFEGSQTIELASGGYHLEIRQTGAGTVLLPINDTYQDGQAYTVFIIGLVNADPRLQTIKSATITRTSPPPSAPPTGALLAPEVAAGLGVFVSLLLIAVGMAVGRRRSN